jgi:hypothetical protein
MSDFRDPEWELMECCSLLATNDRWKAFLCLCHERVFSYGVAAKKCTRHSGEHRDSGDCPVVPMDIDAHYHQGMEMRSSHSTVSL